MKVSNMRTASTFTVTAKGRSALDVGASTGGFTDVLLAHGAARAQGFELIGYHPYAEWYVGCGFASWGVRGSGAEANALPPAT